MDLKKNYCDFCLLLSFFSDRKRVIFQTRRFVHNLKTLGKLRIRVHSLEFYIT